LSMGSLRFFIT